MVLGFYKPLAHHFTAFSTTDIDRYVAAYSVTGAMHSAFGWYRAFPADIQKNNEQLKRKLSMPVLLMGGAQSGGPLMQVTAEEIAEVFTVKVIANCGHWLMDEQPGEVLAALAVFLESTEVLPKA